MKYAEVNIQSYMSMHFLLLELCVDSLEKTTLNQLQIMEKKECCYGTWTQYLKHSSVSKADMLTNSLHSQLIKYDRTVEI